MSNTNKPPLGDYLSLFNYPQPATAPPALYAQQVPPGTGVAPTQPLQGMVQVGAMPQAPPQPQSLAPPPAPPPPPAPHAPPQGQVYSPPPVATTSVGVPAPMAPQPDASASPTVDAVIAQNEAYRTRIAQLEQTEEERTRQAQQTALDGMKPIERVNAKLDLLQHQYQVAAERANQWHVAAERERVMNEHDQGLDPSRLDTTSLEALRASVPAARQAYVEFENRVANKIRQEVGMQTQLQVEGLPPAPVMQGLPSPNSGGAVPSVPGLPQQQQAAHPMMRDNYLQYTPNPAYGRVYQPQPGALPAPAPQGQYFPATYPMPAHMQPQVQQQQQQYPSPQVQLVPAQQPMAPQVQLDAEQAKANARQSIMAARKGGMAQLRAQGMVEPASSAIANSNPGASPLTHTAMPDPSMFAGAANTNLHPMHLASGGR